MVPVHIMTQVGPNSREAFAEAIHGGDIWAALAAACCWREYGEQTTVSGVVWWSMWSLRNLYIYSGVELRLDDRTRLRQALCLQVFLCLSTESIFQERMSARRLEN